MEQSMISSGVGHWKASHSSTETPAADAMPSESIDDGEVIHYLDSIQHPSGTMRSDSPTCYLGLRLVPDEQHDSSVMRPWHDASLISAHSNSSFASERARDGGHSVANGVECNEESASAPSGRHSMFASDYLSDVRFRAPVCSSLPSVAHRRLLTDAGGFSIPVSTDDITKRQQMNDYRTINSARASDLCEAAVGLTEDCLPCCDVRTVYDDLPVTFGDHIQNSEHLASTVSAGVDHTMSQSDAHRLVSDHVPMNKTGLPSSVSSLPGRLVYNDVGMLSAFDDFSSTLCREFDANELGADDSNFEAKGKPSDDAESESAVEKLLGSSVSEGIGAASMNLSHCPSTMQAENCVGGSIDGRNVTADKVPLHHERNSVSPDISEKKADAEIIMPTLDQFFDPKRIFARSSKSPELLPQNRSDSFSSERNAGFVQRTAFVQTGAASATETVRTEEQLRSDGSNIESQAFGSTFSDSLVNDKHDDPSKLHSSPGFKPNSETLQKSGKAARRSSKQATATETGDKTKKSDSFSRLEEKPGDGRTRKSQKDSAPSELHTEDPVMDDNPNAGTAGSKPNNPFDRLAPRLPNGRHQGRGKGQRSHRGQTKGSVAKDGSEEIARDRGDSAIQMDPVEKFVSSGVAVVRAGVREAWVIVWNIVKLIIGIIVVEVEWLLSHMWAVAVQVYGYVARWRRARRGSASRTSEGENPFGLSGQYPASPDEDVLAENIALPETGEEAMKRLFACHGKDPYSILGLRPDCTDEQIRRYYRRQAILVHPDKNREPGADEAFKILNQAFEIIGEPDQRSAYDTQSAQQREAHVAMDMFSDLLTKLKDTMKEAMDLIACEKCGGKHKRIAVNRTLFAARFCSKCATHHAVREGDVWAESTMLGFLWKYYSCMEGQVYDITTWASCQVDSFKHLESNAHQIKMRMSTGGRGGQAGQPPRTSGNQNIDDLLNSVFRARGMSPDFSPFAGGAGTQSAASSGATQAAEKQRKKKKRR